MSTYNSDIETSRVVNNNLSKQNTIVALQNSFEANYFIANDNNNNPNIKSFIENITQFEEGAQQQYYFKNKSLTHREYLDNARVKKKYFNKIITEKDSKVEESNNINERNDTTPKVTIHDEYDRKVKDDNRCSISFENNEENNNKFHVPNKGKHKYINEKNLIKNNLMKNKTPKFFSPKKSSQKVSKFNPIGIKGWNDSYFNNLEQLNLGGATNNDQLSKYNYLFDDVDNNYNNKQSYKYRLNNDKAMKSFDIKYKTNYENLDDSDMTNIKGNYSSNILQENNNPNKKRHFSNFNFMGLMKFGEIHGKDE